MKATVLFVLKVLLVGALAIGFLFGVVSPQYTQGFNASILDKVARLRSIAGPKLVLLGNSNLPFGIDSARLEAAIGMPVVNMGLHGGGGNAFHENMAHLSVTPGDIYVVAHTEYNDRGDRVDPGLLWITVENHLDLYPLIARDNYGDMLGALSSYIKKALGLWMAGEGNQAAEGPYARPMVNERGDSLYPRERTEEGLAFSDQEPPYVEDACIDRLNALHAHLAQQGAKMVVAAYPIANGEHTPLVAEYDALQETLEQRLICPVISYFPDYMLDYSYFYDTLYHLTDEGTALRTDLLIDDILRWQAQDAAA